MGFRCPSCGIKLGYTGLRQIPAIAISLAPFCLALLALSQIPLIPNLPIWLFGLGLVFVLVLMFIVGLTGPALLPFLLTAEILDKEFQ
jgi:hypothetical protein